jgi:signal transduction histidine kinase
MNYPDSMNKAIDYLKQAWTIFGKLELYQYEAEFKQGIGIILYKQGKYKSAIDAFEQSIELNDKFNRGYKIKTTSHNLLSKAYEKTGDYKTAIKHMKLFILYSDSLAQKEKYEQIATIEKQYETVKKENKIVRLQAEQELTLIQLRKNKQLKQLGMATALLLLLLVFFISMKYIDKIKSNQLLKEKNQLIEQSEQELRLLNASKNKFFSIIAHDLKNPLHTILGYSYLLNKDYDRFNEEARRKFALNIHQSTNNIFRLLQNLLEWSRSQTGRLNFSPAVVEYQRILDNSLSVLRSMADQKNIVIKAENDPELEIFADPLMIETVLRNLIGNAIKFTPEGGQIDVSAKRENGQILVSVSDTGIGITEEDTKNLFLIDSKVKRKGTNNEDGSGLGLILCQEFVDKHDGKIWVESTLGKGSAFTFSIPAKAIA